MHSPEAILEYETGKILWDFYINSNQKTRPTFS